MSGELTVADLREELEGKPEDAKIHIHASGAFKELRDVTLDDIEWNTGKEETVVSLR